MDSFHITGGKPLHGEITLAGSKNLASKLMIASLLASGTSTLENVPDIGENQIAQDLIHLAGATVIRQGTSITVDSSAISNSDLRAAKQNRLPVLIIAPLLFRTGEAIVPEPGGDRIGARPVNFHVDVLRSFGASVDYEDGYYRAHADHLFGTHINLPFPSVGATETALLAGVWASGTTTISGAATEPEILELIAFLKLMGARITRRERTISIEGTTSFKPAHQRVIPDRIEAVSYAALALATKGSVTLHGARSADLATFTTIIEHIGGRVDANAGSVTYRYEQPLKPVKIVTGVHPGFMTDWQQPTAIMLLTAHGTSTIHETVHEQRFGYVEQLRLMGAQIDITDTTESTGVPDFKLHKKTQIAHFRGPAMLKAATLTMPDLRAGMAYIIAALVAEGQSVVYGIDQVDRGYERIVEKLQALGAQIERRS